MSSHDLMERFAALTTPLVADAMIRLALPVKIAPAGIRPLVGGSKFAGPASPVVLHGFADRVLECVYRSDAGDVLVLDNRGRSDQACCGDLVAYEARSQGLVGVVVWGCHRDSAEVAEIGVPLFSYGTYPLGLQRTYAPVPDPFARCQFGEVSVERGEAVFADDDGVLFVPREQVTRVLDAADELRAAEHAQVARIRAGSTLREQLQFDVYMRERDKDPTLTLGEHMKRLGRHF
jgi:4-hydroxy-4-methyl-2-oxoglutarate aldolase